VEVIKRERDAATLRFSEEELYILNNALNEVCNGLHISEFSTRMGAEREEALQQLEQINALLTNREM
jgi:hypothetical protein